MYRKFTEQDVPLLKAAIECDPEHRLVKENQSFLPEIMLDPQNISLVFEDSEGVVFYTCFRKEYRVDIQFRDINRDRIRKCFAEYIPAFTKVLKQNGVTALTFTTNNRVLAFFLRRFGFIKEEICRKVL